MNIELHSTYSTRRAFCGGGGGTAWPVDGLLGGNSKRPNFSLDSGMLCVGDAAGTAEAAFDDRRPNAEKADNGSGVVASDRCFSFPLPEILPRIVPKMPVFDDIRVWRRRAMRAPSWLADERAGLGTKVRLAKSGGGVSEGKAAAAAPRRVSGQA